MDYDSISALVIRRIPVKHPDGNCTCDGSSLEFNGHRFMQNIDQYYQQIARTPTGRVAKKQPKNPPTQPHTWWKAQCSFRGLSPKGTMAQLQELLKEHAKDPISKDNLALLEEAKMEFMIKNSEAVEDKWVHRMSAEEKAIRDPGRYLREVFPVGETVTGVIVVRVGYGTAIRAIAEDLGLEAEDVEAPIDRKVSWATEEHWVVVGQKKPEVAEKVRSISREAQRIKKEIKQEEDEQKKEDEAIEKKREQNLKRALAKSKDWDVTGSWKISCPYIEENWSQEDWDEDGLTLQIYQEKTPKGAQMFAKFNFGVTTGVFRFERQRDDTKVKVSKPDVDRNKKKRKRYDSEEDDDSANEDNSSEEDDTDEEEEDEERERSPTPEAFYFESITQPSAKYQTWNYRWRGEETGEGAIELYSDKRLFAMKFFGPKVEKLEGTFGGDMFKDCTFTGVKVGVVGVVDIDIAEEWAERNEHAYESARVGRWH